MPWIRSEVRGCVLKRQTEIRSKYPDINGKFLNRPGESWKGISLNKRRIGTSYEIIAANYLKEQGVRILEKNYRLPQGEIDLIAEDKDCVIFVEVKYRKTADFGYPYEAVSKAKQYKICQIARQFVYSRRIRKQVRYDIISICGDRIHWYQNAFEHTGQY